MPSGPRVWEAWRPQVGEALGAALPGGARLPASNPGRPPSPNQRARPFAPSNPKSARSPRLSACAVNRRKPERRAVRPDPVDAAGECAHAHCLCRRTQDARRSRLRGPSSGSAPAAGVAGSVRRVLRAGRVGREGWASGLGFCCRGLLPGLPLTPGAGPRSRAGSGRGTRSRAPAGRFLQNWKQTAFDVALLWFSPFQTLLRGA